MSAATIREPQNLSVREASQSRGRLAAMSSPDYATWLTKAQAAAALSVSTKTIEKYAQAGQIEQAAYRRPTGGPKLAVYNPADVDRLQHPPPAPFVVPPAPPAVRFARPSTAVAPLEPPSPGEDLVRALLHGLRQSAPTSPKSETVFLTLAEAAGFTGLTVTRLRRQCQQGTLPAIKDRGWKIRRVDLASL